MTCRLTIASPVGPLTLEGDAEAIHAVRFHGPHDAEHVDTPPLLQEAARQLTAYFAGERRSFDLPLRPAGTPFQQAVWSALQEIPYGEVRSYAQIAARIGRPKATRAVGMANHRNPLPILIPCHRVIGSSGALTGYGGGLSVKERLLRLEGYYLF